MTMIQNPYMFDPYTKMLLHTRGADESTSFLDASPSNHTMTAQADAQIDTAVADPWGGNAGVMMLDGTGDYVSAPDSADWAFGTGNFSLEGWYRFPGVAQRLLFMGQTVDANNRSAFFYDNSPGKIQFYVRESGTVTCYYLADWSPSADTWYHLAVARSGTAIYMFIDGTSLSLTETTAIASKSMPDYATTFDIGRVYSGNELRYLSGYATEIKISKGIARWTGNFTPPIKPY